MAFYTNVNCKKNTLYVSGYRDGKRFKERVAYEPYLFMPCSNQDSPYKDIHDSPVERVQFQSMLDARVWAKNRKKLENVKTYGMTDFQFVYLNDMYPGRVDFDFGLLKVVSIDIENDSRGGFADMDKADKEINAITISKKERSVTFGFHDYALASYNRVYIKCKDEVDLLKKFLVVWNSQQWRPDIITGWNNKFFDIRYIVNRMKRVLPQDEYLKLSPFRIVEPERVTQKDGREFNTYNLFGISTVDYLEIYRKFAQGERESFKLDFIADYELKQRKVDYSEYGTLAKLYEQNPELYYTYNIEDTELILRLEDKLHYIEQVVTMAYICKVNFDNMVKTVKPWDVLIHNYLMDRGIVVPFIEDDDDPETIIGGYCKPIRKGMYKNIASLDFTSLYPSIAMTCNISPDTFVGKSENFDRMSLLDDQAMEKYTVALRQKNLAMTVNGSFFKRDKKGFIPSIMEYFFTERKRVRAEEAIARKESDRDPKNQTKRNAYLRLKNLQTAYKLINNSGYGAIANRFFRWFDNRLAEGITMTGQMTAIYVALKLNEVFNERFNTTNEDYVVYQDTDSAYVDISALGTDNVEQLIEFMTDFVQPKVEEICTQFSDKINAFERHLSMKLEKICDHAFIMSKKRYALSVRYDEGIVKDKGKLKITGLWPVRSEIPKVCREAMKEVYQLIFDENQEGIYKYIIDFKEKFYGMSFEQIATSTSCNNLYQYADGEQIWKLGTPVAVKGALIFNRFILEKKLDSQYELIYDHDKVKYAYLNPENPTRQGVISIKGSPPPELEIEKFIDYDHMWEKTFLGPIKEVCDVVGMKTTSISSLDDIF